MPTPHIWLRAETKPFEQRTALPPSGVEALLEAGFTVTVEDSPQNIYATEEYVRHGCQIAPAGSWPTAPGEAIILGLKELPEAGFPLPHRHIYFAHAYKKQAGAEKILRRFTEGGGTLFDLEFLTDPHGRRVAAFGFWAGFAGAALAVQAWAGKEAGHVSPLPPIKSLPSEQALIDQVETTLAGTASRPTIHVIGALGRSGRGACAVAEKLGLPLIAWDQAETLHGGPFPALVEADIFVNCVLLNAALPPFLTRDLLMAPNRTLSVIADVSCDPTSPYNPLPIYDSCTSFAAPCHAVSGLQNPPHIIAIDHLPSLLPRESSEDYCLQLMPYLLGLDTPHEGVWGRARDLFERITEDMRIGS